jgi:hypothetical protein
MRDPPLVQRNQRLMIGMSPRPSSTSGLKDSLRWNLECAAPDNQPVIAFVIAGSGKVTHLVHRDWRRRL